MLDKFVMSVRQAAELDHALARNGWTSALVKKLSEGDMLTNVLRVVLGQAEIVATKHLIDLDANPFVPDGWSVKEHQKGGQFQWDAAKVKLYLASVQKDSKVILGDKLRKELAEKPVFNANLLDYLLTNPHLIPEEWKGKRVYFWGTIYCGRDGLLFVSYLRWYRDGWSRNHNWLDYGTHGNNDPALVDAS